MPLYEYVCQDCGHRFDSLRSMKQADLPLECKKCSSLKTTRLISVFFAQSEGRSITATPNSCGGCSGGSCSSCKH